MFFSLRIASASFAAPLEKKLRVEFHSDAHPDVNIYFNILKIRNQSYFLEK
jgi:hypothetical protein